jgi:hypothetical protein
MQPSLCLVQDAIGDGQVCVYEDLSSVPRPAFSSSQVPMVLLKCRFSGGGVIREMGE